MKNFDGVGNGKIQADFYDDCWDIPDPSSLDPTQNNMLLWGHCLQNNAEACYTQGRHFFQLPRHTIRENSNFIILFPQDVKNLTHIHAGPSDLLLSEFKKFCHGVWSSEKFCNYYLTNTPMGGKYHKNFNRFYFPAGTI